PETVRGSAARHDSSIEPPDHDRPKLPWRTIRHTNFAYWTGAGLSAPSLCSAALIWASFVKVFGPHGTSRQPGGSGISLKIANVTSVIAKSMSRPESSRLTM